MKPKRILAYFLARLLAFCFSCLLTFSANSAHAGVLRDFCNRYLVNLDVEPNMDFIFTDWVKALGAEASDQDDEFALSLVMRFRETAGRLQWINPRSKDPSVQILRGDLLAKAKRLEVYLDSMLTDPHYQLEDTTRFEIEKALSDYPLN